jgi:hypothetical protein
MVKPGAPDPRPEIWSAEDEAKRLSITRRKLAYLITRHKPPILRAGRDVFFDDVAHRFLIEAMRAPVADVVPPRLALTAPTSATAAERHAAAAVAKVLAMRPSRKRNRQ